MDRGSKESLEVDGADGFLLVSSPPELLQCNVSEIWRAGEVAGERGHGENKKEKGG